MLGDTDPTPDEQVAKFKRDLEALRGRYRDSSFKHLERKLRRDYPKQAVGKNPLNEAVLQHYPLPRAAVVYAMVLALTDDQDLADAWVQRRDEIASRIEPSRLPSAETTDGADDGDLTAATTSAPVTKPRRKRRSVIAALLVGVTVVLAFTHAWAYELGRSARNDPPEAAAPSSAANQAAHVATGDDGGRVPACSDAKIAVSADGPGFTTAVVFSAACNAAWGKITRHTGPDIGNTITVDIYRQADPNGPTRQHTTEPDVHSAYTTLIVRSGNSDRLCVTGSVTTGSRVEQVPYPLCI